MSTAYGVLTVRERDRATRAERGTIDQIDAIEEDACPRPVQYQGALANDPVGECGAIESPFEREMAVGARNPGTPELRNPRTLCYSNQSSGWRMKKFRTTSSTSESAGSDDQSSK